MKIKEIQVCRLQPPDPTHEGPAQSRPGWGATSVQATPMNRFEEGIRWLGECEQNWSGQDYMACHTWWHLAMFHLETLKTAEHFV